MRRTATPVIIGLLLVTILAGCSTSANHHSVYFSGTVEVEDGQFVMDGNVSLSIGAQPDTTFEDVKVVLYDENKEEIRRVPVGKLSTTPPPLTQRINITTDRIPEYAVIESPDLWTSDATLSILAYERPGDGSSYKEYSRLYADQKFPMSKRASLGKSRFELQILPEKLGNGVESDNPPSR